MLSGWEEVGIYRAKPAAANSGAPQPRASPLVSTAADPEGPGPSTWKSRCTRSPALGAAARPVSLTEGGAGGSGASVHLGVTWEWAGGGGNHRPDYKTTPPRLRARASRAVRSPPLRAGLLTAGPAGKPRPSQPREPGRRVPRSERGRAGAEAGRGQAAGGGRVPGEAGRRREGPASGEGRRRGEGGGGRAKGPGGAPGA